MIEFKTRGLIDNSCNIAVTLNQRTVHFKEHKHDFAEFVYILSGNCLHFINGVPYEVHKGDFIYIAAGETHAFESDEEVCSYDIYVRSQFLYQKMLAEQPNAAMELTLFREFSAEIAKIAPCVSFQGADMLEIENLLHYMYAESGNLVPGKDAVLQGYTFVLVAKFLREIRKKRMALSNRQLQTIMPKILQYIEENYCKVLSLEELAEQSFYNPSYFSRIFKERYGKTLTEYITEKRIAEAIRLLENSNLTIEEIGRRVGYTDKKHFYKMFRQKTDLTPGQYRRETTHNKEKKEPEA